MLRVVFVCSRVKVKSIVPVLWTIGKLTNFLLLFNYELLSNLLNTQLFSTNFVLSLV